MTAKIAFARLASAIALLVFALPLAAQEQARQQPAGTQLAQPPRTVEDILAVLDQYQPDPAVVQRLREQAERQPPATEDRAELARFYHARARAVGRLGYVGRQIEDLRKAAQYAAGTLHRNTGSETNQGLGEESRILGELARAESLSGNFVNSVRMREELLRRVEQSGGLGGLRFANYAALAGAAVATGDLESAKANFGRAEKIYAALQKNAPRWPDFRYGWTALLERVRAGLYLAEGKYAAAEASLRKALKETDDGTPQQRRLLRAGRNVIPLGAWEATRNGEELRLAQIMRVQGRLSEAELAARNALRRNLSFFGRYSPATAGALVALGGIIYEQGRYREAALLARVAIETLEQAGAVPESNNMLRSRRAYATTLVAEQKWREALAVYEIIARDAARDPLVQRVHGGGDINWAWALIHTNQAALATTMLERLFERVRSRLGDADYRTAEVRAFLAMAYQASGQRERALAEFRAAVPALLEQARIDQSAEDAGLARAQRFNAILAAYIALLSEFHQSGTPVPGFDPVAESFRVADAARASTVQRAFTESAARGAIRDPHLAGLARAEQDAQHRLGVLSELLSRLLAAPPDQQLPKVIGDLRRDLEELRKTRRDLKARIERQFPGYANLVDPKPATIIDAQRSLRNGEALIAMFAAEERSFVWAVPREGRASFAVVPMTQAKLVEEVAALRRALDVGDVLLTRMPRFDLALAYDLYRQFIRPVEGAWKSAQSLLIAPHGALGQLPFALLPTEPAQLPASGEVLFEEYKKVPWLIRMAAVTQLPSVATLTALRSLPAASSDRRAFAGFGDPWFSNEQAAQASKEASLAPAASTRGVGLRNLTIAKVAAPPVAEAIDGAEVPLPPSAPAVINSSTLAQLARLPDTAEEIREIAQALHADSAQDVFLGARASKRTIKTTDLSRRRIIAFATHGLVPGDLNGLAQPALALSAPEVTGDSGDDGLLTMEEVLGLKLNADWVVLSACNTGTGDGAGSEAVSGLGRAFFYAGARALLVSNWPVETVSARLLTTRLFRHQAENPGLTRAEALRRSMLDLLDGPGFLDPASKRTLYSYAHPMFWAPFSLVGDGAGR